MQIKYRYLLLLTMACVCMGADVNAQTGANDTLLHEAVIYNGDTIESKTLDYVYLYTKLTEVQKAANAKYNRLRNAVYVTYPFARRAGLILNDMNVQLAIVQGKEARKNYIKSREKELKKEFTDPLTNLSVYQGKVLMKLINRETGNNCYDIIKDYRGGFTARFYQTVAFFFSSNLKQPYESEKDDAVIERIVQEVQRMYGYRDIRKTAMM